MARATKAFEAADIGTVPATTARQQSSGFRLLRRLQSERKAIAGLIIIALLALVAIFGPALAPYHPDADDFGILQTPSLQHPMGTDSFGRDLLSRLIIGTRVSFSVGFLAAVVALSIGGTLGMMAGYYGRWVDSVISRAVDLCTLGLSGNHPRRRIGRHLWCRVPQRRYRDRCGLCRRLRADRTRRDVKPAGTRLHDGGQGAGRA